ncbi:hypothetical protein [Lactococcus petauri]|uniref:hypothetical protein n=1 Tax=Lactococcus petauri TaxID=1940789 RepID=UPI00254F3941|nr:hypothetical protein [Lactococcus petauri]
MKLLEANIFDNFNPNSLNIYDFELPGGAGYVTRPIPKPKALAQVLDYELWETGYSYTSSALFSTTVEVGDIVQIKTVEDVPLATAADKTEIAPLSYIYLVTDVDENNRATLKNYFWAMIEGVEIPTTTLNAPNSSILVRMTEVEKTTLMSHGLIYNPSVFTGVTKFNRKTETTDAESVAKDIFSSVRYQPTALIRIATYDINGQLSQPRDTIQINLSSRTWNRKNIATRIDEALNPSMEIETVVERSNYNFALVYWKADQEAKYPNQPELYTIDDNGNVVDMRNYSGDGYNLPGKKIIKTLFYDEGKPTTAQIKAEITGDTIIHKIYFNQDPKLPLYTNDLVTVWYNGVSYSGHIADHVKTPITDRLLFVEGFK